MKKIKAIGITGFTNGFSNDNIISNTSIFSNSKILSNPEISENLVMEYWRPNKKGPGKKGPDTRRWEIMHHAKRRDKYGPDKTQPVKKIK